MPFQKGHKLTPKTPANTKGGLVGAARTNPKMRRARMSTAHQLQEDVCSAYISAWLLAMASGHDPRVVLRNVNPRTGQKMSAPKDQKPLFEQKPTLAESLQAMNQLLLRRDGQPAQYTHIQQEVTAQVLAIRADVSRDEMAKMSRVELRQLGETMRRLMPGVAEAARDEAQARVIAESAVQFETVETPVIPADVIDVDVDSESE